MKYLTPLTRFFSVFFFFFFFFSIHFLDKRQAQDKTIPEEKKQGQQKNKSSSIHITNFNYIYQHGHQLLLPQCSFIIQSDPDPSLEGDPEADPFLFC